eukprot:972982-Prymnesium_polylepis.1
MGRKGATTLLSLLTTLAVGRGQVDFAVKAELDQLRADHRELIRALEAAHLELRTKVEALEATNAQQRHAGDKGGDATARVEFSVAGRQLSSSSTTCCRWTQSNACGSIPEGRHY